MTLPHPLPSPARLAAALLALMLALIPIGCDDSANLPFNEAPTVVITSPDDGAVFDSGAEITFTGTADDPEDGPLTGDALTWRSSNDVNLGAGATLTLKDLTDGRHAITLTATDTEGAAASAQITVTVGDPSTLRAGVLTAPTVSGLDYESDWMSGKTDTEGRFSYVTGQPVTFSIGALKLAEIDSKPVVTPMDLAEGALSPSDQAAVNVTRFLMTIDADADASNGIQIDAAMRDRTVARQIDWSATNEDFAAAIAPALMDLYEGDPPALMTAEDAGEALATAVRNLVTTRRDGKGVWFITGDEHLYSVFEAMGYAVATDRLWQTELYRRSARGLLAEIFGQGQLETDVFMRTIGYSDAELTAGFDALDPETRVTIAAYVDGFNRRIGEIAADPATLLPFEFVAIGQQLGVDFIPALWTVEDVLAWEALMLRQFDPEALKQGQLDNARLYAQLAATFPAGANIMFNDLRWTNDAKALTYIAPEAAGPDARSAAGSSFQEAFQAPGDSGALPVAQAGTSARAIAGAGNAAAAVADRLDAVFANLDAINARVLMGSYAWAVSGDKTASGDPILYSGPQMGFSVPSIVMEGSIEAGDLKVSGMCVPGLPGIIIGRTPHHAWSMQVGHARTVDYYLEAPENVTLHRVETIRVAGGEDVTLPVYRTAHGPLVNPIPYDPATYQQSQENPLVSWKYAHWGYEFQSVAGMMDLAQAKSMDEFGAGIDKLGVSQHFCYADRDGNIAYWMSGRDPARPAGEYRLPQGMAAPQAEWDAAVLRQRSTERNPAKGYFGGWNNKTSPDYGNAYNNYSYYFGPFHRAHVVDEYLAAHDNLTFDEVRNLALNIATTDSFGAGGNPWAFVSGVFSDAVAAAPTEARTAALEVMDGWDGHFVAGGPEAWAAETDRADAWMLMDAWIRETLRLAFEDELGAATYGLEQKYMLFNVFLRAVRPELSDLTLGHDWMTNMADAEAPQTADAIIVQALDNALAALGERPWGTGKRGVIAYTHAILPESHRVVHEMPFASRSTYAHCVAFDEGGQARIESMFPLGESGDIRMEVNGTPIFDDHFFSMTPLFDTFTHRDFPVFEAAAGR